MKRIIASLAALLLFAACGSKNNQFTLTVHLGDQFSGAQVYLFDEASHQPIDSAVAEGPTVILSGLAEEPFVGHVVVNGGMAHGILFLEPGHIYFDPVSDSLAGTPLNDAYAETFFSADYYAERDAFMAQYERYMTGDAALQTALTPVLDSLYGEWTATQTVAFTILYFAHPDDILGAYAFTQIAASYQSTAEMEYALEQASDFIRAYPPVQQMLEQLRVLDRTAIGAQFIDFEGTDYQTGEKASLAQMIDGKLALVDVWASWCGPCRSEIKENLLRIHKEYKDKGLYVLGVDVSDKPENHRKAMADLGIDYDQLIDTENLCCDLYGIQGIPHIMHIAPDGTILARDLRGSAIEEALKEALK